MLGEGEAVKEGEMPEAEAVAVEETDQVDATNTTSSMPLLSSLFGMPRFKVYVTTGDKAGAGTDSTVYLRLVDSTKSETQWTRLDKLFRNDHERGETHKYSISAEGLDKPEQLACIQIKRKCTIIDDHWFLDRVEVEDTSEKTRYVYPVQRWIKSNVDYTLYEHDAFLPCQDPREEERKIELEEKREAYQFKETIPDGPRQVKNLPSDEEFSSSVKSDIVIEKGKLLLRKLFLTLTTDKWNSMDDVKNVYFPNQKLPKPACIEYWADDKWFGLQRVQGVNPHLITLCKEIPEKLAIDAALLEPLLEGYSVNEALSNNKLFIIDLEILDGNTCKIEKMVAPIALFYLNKEDELLPVAIQIHQKPSPSNPVFMPTDPQHTWTLAKMFYNMAEAQHHQAFSHLGMVHLMMESMCVAAHRNLSPSHPIFRLLAPHFLFLLAINSRGLEKLLSPGGWVDAGMAVGRDGMIELIGRCFQRWRLSVNGSIISEIKSRGVLDPSILPYYPYREDAVPLFQIIKSYVSNVVNYYYDSPEKLASDYEVQNWVKEMSKPHSEEGCGIAEMYEQLDNVEQLVSLCTTIISTCSIAHAGSFQQYDAYGFVPNYPGVLKKSPPQTKDAIEEDALLEYLPDKETTLYIMVITNLLSRKGTQSLGDFEVQYLHDPKVVAFVKEFRLHLSHLSLDMKRLNTQRKIKHDWLDPDIVPNSISI